MRHFWIMCLFAAIVAVCFGVISKETPRAQLKYGLKVFAEFVLFALALGWILYFLPL